MTAQPGPLQPTVERDPQLMEPVQNAYTGDQR